MMKILALGTATLLCVVSCTSFVEKKQLSSDIQYVNYQDGKLTESKTMWEPAYAQNDKVEVRIVTSGFKFTPSCFTMLIGINQKGEAEEMAVSHHFGDKQQLFSNAKKYRSTKLNPTKHNPSGLPAVVKIKTYTYSDDKQLTEEYKRNCSEYI